MIPEDPTEDSDAWSEHKMKDLGWRALQILEKYDDVQCIMITMRAQGSIVAQRGHRMEA